MSFDIDLGGIDASSACLHRLAHVVHRPLIAGGSVFRMNLWYDLVLPPAFDPLLNEGVEWMPCRKSSAHSTDARAAIRMRRRDSVMSFDFHPIVEAPPSSTIDIAFAPIDIKSMVLSGRELGTVLSRADPIIVASRRHAEKVSHHCALNQQVLELIPSLYRKEARVVQEERVFEKRSITSNLDFLSLCSTKTCFRLYRK